MVNSVIKKVDTTVFSIWGVLRLAHRSRSKGGGEGESSCFHVVTVGLIVCHTKRTLVPAPAMGLFGAFRVAGVAVCLLVSALLSTALGPNPAAWRQVEGFEPAQQGLLIINATRLPLSAGASTPGTVDECALACIRSTRCLSFNIRASATGSAMVPGPQWCRARSAS